MVYELFTTAFITDVDKKNATSIISGYTWDQPHRRLYRVLYFGPANPNQPKGLTNLNNVHGLPPEPDYLSMGLPSYEPPPPPGTRIVEPEWQELANVMKKQSYIVNARYEIDKDRHMGNPQPIAPNYFDSNPGALFWSEIPDPVSIAGGQALILQRNKIEIHDQLNLPTVMRDNDFRFRSESIEETHDFYHREVPIEFHFKRLYKIPTNPANPQPLTHLPPLDSLPKVDPAGRWMLEARAYVLKEHSPENIKKARDDLAKAVEDLTMPGMTFMQMDRKIYDTQLAGPRNTAAQSFGDTQTLAGATAAGRA